MSKCTLNFCWRQPLVLSVLFLLCVSCAEKNSGGNSADKDTAAGGTDSFFDSASESSSEDVDTDTIAGLPLDTDFETDPAELNLGESCANENHIGGFEVVMNGSAGYTAIEGSVKNSVNPAVLSEQVVIDGSCILRQNQRLICDPVCLGGETCGLNETCVPMPTGQDVGIVAIQGLVETVIMAPVQPGNTYFYTQLSHPGFVPGQVIRLTTTGGYYDALELFGVGVAPLLSFDHQWVLTQGRPLELMWPAPANVNSPSSMIVSLNIDQHGLTPVTLECEFSDVGQGTISAEMVDALIEAGVTGFPSGTMTRRTVDSTISEKGCVDFQVTSFLAANVEVSGHIPCARNTDCPSGWVCQKEIGKCAE